MARRQLPARLGSVFTLQEATELGLTRKHLRRPDLSSPFRGVRARELDVRVNEQAADRWRRELRQSADAYRCVMHGHVFFSHVTAAVLWDLPVPTPAELAFELRGRVADVDSGSATDEDLGDRTAQSQRHRVDVCTMHPNRAPRAAGVRGRQIQPHLASAVVHDGYRLASPATTWAMLADELALRDLVALGDAIIRVPRHPGGFKPPARPALATIEQLRAAVSAGPRAGIAKLREALPLLRQGVSSRPETHSRLILVDGGLVEPSLDVDVYDAAGRFLGCSELAYPTFKVAVEYEGDHHRIDRAQWNRDIEKYQRYAEAGWTVIRLTKDLVYRNPTEAVRRVRAALVAAGWHR